MTVDQFFNDALTDKALQEEMLKCDPPCPESFANKVVELGKAKGFSINTNDVEDWLQRKKNEARFFNLSGEALGLARNIAIARRCAE
jgi:Nif11 domain